MLRAGKQEEILKVTKVLTVSSKFYITQQFSNINNKSSYLSLSWWGQSHCELLSNWNDRNLSHQYQNHQIWAEFAVQALHEFPIHRLCYWERSVGSLSKQEFHFQGPEWCVHIHHLQKNKNKSDMHVHLQSFTVLLVILFSTSGMSSVDFLTILIMTQEYTKVSHMQMKQPLWENIIQLMLPNV